MIAQKGILTRIFIKALQLYLKRKTDHLCYNDSILFVDITIRNRKHVLSLSKYLNASS